MIQVMSLFQGENEKPIRTTTLTRRLIRTEALRAQIVTTVKTNLLMLTAVLSRNFGDHLVSKENSGNGGQQEEKVYLRMHLQFKKFRPPTKLQHPQKTSHFGSQGLNESMIAYLGIGLGALLISNQV